MAIISPGYYTSTSTFAYGSASSISSPAAGPTDGSSYFTEVKPDYPLDLKVLNKDTLKRIENGRSLSLKEDHTYTSEVNPYNERISPAAAYLNLISLVQRYPGVFSYRDERFGSQNLRRFIAENIPEDLLQLSGALCFNGTIYQMHNYKEGLQMHSVKVRPLPKVLDLFNNRFIRRGSDTSSYVRTIKRDGVTLYGWADSHGNLQFSGKYLLHPEESILAKQVVEGLSRDRQADIIKYLRDFTIVFEYASPDIISKVKHPNKTLTVIALVRLSDGDVLPASGRMLGSALNYLWKEEVLKGSSDLTNIEGEIWTIQGGVMAKVYTDWYESVRDLDIIQGVSL